MSDIPYPHRADVRAAPAGDGLTLDAWGNAVSGEPATVDTIDCWVQSKTLQQRAEAASLAETGDDPATHTVFCEPRVFAPNEYLVTLAGGGQMAGVRHRVTDIRNPDGGLDHLELDTLVVSRGT